MATMRPQSEFERELVSNAQRFSGGERRERLLGLEDVALRRLQRGNATDIARGLGRVSADVAQQFAAPTTDRNQAVDNALRRGRALARLGQFTTDESNNQLLRDRMAVAQIGRQRQGRGMSALAQAADIDTHVLASLQSLGQASRDARSNMLGTLTGIGLGFATDGDFQFRRRARNSVTGSSAQGRLPQAGVGVA